ncbi:unnamed protein product, partial [Sphacelaria rigidula]
LPHLVRDCEAKVIRAPSQENEASENDSGELAELKSLAAGVTRPFCEEWYGDTGAPHHLTDSLRCMRDLTPVDFSVAGIGGVTCNVSLKGNLTVVFVTDEVEYVADLQGVLYAPDLGYNLFSPSSEFNGEGWDRLGGPDRIMTAFNGRVTFANQDGMLVAIAYRLGEQFNASVLPALKPSNPPPVTSMDINMFHCIYGHANEQLLRNTAKHLGVTLEGNMHACTGCSMAKGYRKGIPHQTKKRASSKLGRVFVDLGGRKDIASVGGKHYPMIIKDDYSRKSWLYFLTRKSDSDMAFNRFLASVRANGFPSVVQIVRSDNGGEFFGDKFRSVCDELLIKQEFTPANSPQYNGVAER